jgi:hypothetical protein
MTKQQHVIFDCKLEPVYKDYEDNNYHTIGCGPAAGGIDSSRVFFVTFLILVQYILLNLFIAVVLQAFAESSEDENSPINQDHIDIFTKKWKEFDPKGQGYIGCNDFKNDLKSDNKSQLHEFITSLPEPLGIEEKCISTFNDK